MPNMYAHLSSAARSLEMIQPTETAWEVITQHRQAYDLGSQGPDPWFYYRIWPWASSGQMFHLAKRLHQEKISLFFEECLVYLLLQPPVLTQLLAAYLMGYASHYSLDSTCHPYILYRTGMLYPDKPLAGPEVRDHNRMETEIDVLLLAREKGKPPAWLKTQGLFKISNEEVLHIGRMFTYVVARVYGISLPSIRMLIAVQDTRAVYSLLLDDQDLRTRLLYRLVPLFDRSGVAQAGFYPRQVTDDQDWLNLEKRPWRLPLADDRPMQNESFLELLEQASVAGSKNIRAIAQALRRELSSEQAAQQIGNRSMITGLESETGNVQ